MKTHWKKCLLFPCCAAEASARQPSEPTCANMTCGPEHCGLWDLLVGGHYITLSSVSTCAVRGRPAIKLVSADEKDIYLERLAVKNYSFMRKALVCKLTFLFWELIGLPTTIKQKYQVMTLLLLLMLASWPLQLFMEVLLVPDQCQAQSRSSRKICWFN